MAATSKLGSLLRRLREEKKMTQAEVAEASGLSRVQVAYLETGKRGGGRVGWETMTGLARVFGVSADEFAKLLAAELPSSTESTNRRGRPRKDAGDDATAPAAPSSAPPAPDSPAPLPAAGDALQSSTAKPGKRAAKASGGKPAKKGVGNGDGMEGGNGKGRRQGKK